MLHLALFLIFAAVAVAGALNLLLQKHPISSALSLIVVMGALAAEYMLLGAEFVAVIQVIIYAGAIMVLFVFVIMLLNAGEEERSSKGSRVAMALGIPAMVVIGLLIAAVLLHNHAAATAVPAGALPGPPKDIGRLLFHEFLLPFEITSVLILIAIMGAVVLAKPKDVSQSGLPARRED
jgi:NADH-quinone oxidoreductase subunit J